MKTLRTIVLAVLIVAAVGFGGAKIYQHAAQQTSGTQPYQNVRPQIAVPYSPYASGNLSPASPIWNQFEETSVPLLAQVLMIPWGEGATPSVEVIAIYDNRNIAVRLSWADETPNNVLIRNSDRPDGAALMFPLEKEDAPASIMMGFLKPVNIWHWKAARRNEGLAKPYIDYYNPNERGTLLAAHREDIIAALPGSDPRKSSLVRDFQGALTRGEIIDNIATMPGTITPKENQQVSGRGVWSAGRWTVSFSRPLQTPSDQDTQIDAPGTLPAAFAVWKGEKQERGSRKSISDWIVLKLFPREGNRP